MKIKIVLFFAALSASLNAAADDAGRDIALDRAKGNCIACHAMPGEPKAVAAGNIGPALTGMKTRFPDKAKLRAQIWDATANKPESVMPPFGRNKILSDKEIDEVVDYIQGL